MKVHIGRAFLIAAALIVAVGCSGSESSVSGTVLVDGQPLKEGDIIFEPADGQGVPRRARSSMANTRSRSHPA